MGLPGFTNGDGGKYEDYADYIPTTSASRVARWQASRQWRQPRARRCEPAADVRSSNGGFSPATSPMRRPIQTVERGPVSWAVDGASGHRAIFDVYVETMRNSSCRRGHERQQPDPHVSASKTRSTLPIWYRPRGGFGVEEEFHFRAHPASGGDVSQLGHAERVVAVLAATLYVRQTFGRRTASNG